MIELASPPEMHADPQGGWQLVFLTEAFNYETPFRAMLIEIADALGQDAQDELCLPPYEENEDFIEGSLQFGAARLRVYFEYTLGYLALMSGEEPVLRNAADRIRPRISIISADGFAT